METVISCGVRRDGVLCHAKIVVPVVGAADVSRRARESGWLTLVGVFGDTYVCPCCLAVMAAARGGEGAKK